MPKSGVLFLLLFPLFPAADDADLAGEIADRIAACGRQYREQAGKYVEYHEKLKALQAGTDEDLGKLGNPAFDAHAVRYYDAADAILKAEKECQEAAQSCSKISSEEGLNRFLQRTKQGRSAPLGSYYVKGLGAIRHEGAVPALLDYLKPDNPWRCRVSALDALARRSGRNPEVISRVQECLPDPDTRVARAAIEAFAALTGGRPAAGAGAGGRDEGVRATFYEIDIQARSVIFVVDSSNSMKGAPGESKKKDSKKKEGATKFEIMKKELKKAIGGLPDGALVNIVDFNALVYVMSPRMLELGPSTRPEVEAYIDRMRMFFATNICEALSMAMMIAHGILGGDVATGRESKAVDAIFFLTDGKPVVPQRFRQEHGVSKTKEILSRVRFWNQDLRIPVHVIGIGAGEGDFLPTLAKEHKGKYVTP